MSRDPNSDSRIRPVNREAESRQPYGGAIAAHSEDIRPLRRDYDDLRLGQRNRPDDIVVVD